MKKRSDGLYQMSVLVTERGKEKRKYFYGHTKQEAKAKMIAWQSEMSAGRTFSAVAEEWQKQHWKEIAAGTQVSYNPAYNRAISDFSNRRIKEIAPLDIKRSVDAMASKGYAHHSVAIYLSVLNQIFNHGILMQDITTNPTETVKVPKGLSSTARECPEDEQLEIIRKSVDEPFGLFAYMLLYTGLRRGEILALQWKDINFAKQTISISKSVTYAGTGNKPEIKSTKTESGVREIVLLDRLRVKLFELRGKPDEYIFGGTSPLTQSVYRSRWRKYCLNAGLWTMKEAKRTRKQKNITLLIKTPNITPHQLRHAFATMCFEMGITPKDAQQLLGHSKIEVTMDTYTHISKSHRKEVAQKLNAAK